MGEGHTQPGSPDMLVFREHWPFFLFRFPSGDLALNGGKVGRITEQSWADPSHPISLYNHRGLTLYLASAFYFSLPGQLTKLRRDQLSRSFRVIRGLAGAQAYSRASTHTL